MQVNILQLFKHASWHGIKLFILFFSFAVMWLINLTVCFLLLRISLYLLLFKKKKKSKKRTKKAKTDQMNQKTPTNTHRKPASYSLEEHLCCFLLRTNCIEKYASELLNFMPIYHEMT